MIYAVAGGNRVTVALDRETSGGAVDLIEVLAPPGGGPPAHRHAFGEWFRILEGELTLTSDRDGVLRAVRVLKTGESVWIPPWMWHGTRNLSSSSARFEVVGQPGAMTGYFAEAGVAVPDERTPPERPPAGPDALADIAVRWGIEFWTGPISRE